MSGAPELTQREISRAIRELDRLERDEIQVVAEPIREKYRHLKNALKDQCEHSYRLNLDAGIVPWIDNYYCIRCNKKEVKVDEDMKEQFTREHPELLEEE